MSRFDLQATGADIVNAALRVVGAKEEAETANANQIADGLEALNFMVKHWQSQGIHLWRKREGVLFLEYGQDRYLLGPSGDRTTLETDFVETALDGALLTGAASITVDSTADMTAGDNIGIRITSQLRHWTTIVSVDSATTLTITTGIPDDADDGALVYTYTSLIERPLRILHGRRRAGGPSVGEIPTFEISRRYYFDLPVRKVAQGLPVEHHYTPILDNGELYLWPTPDNVDYLFKFTFTDPLKEFDVNSDLADFPREWFRVLKWGLAAEIVDEYRNPLAERQWIKSKADEFLRQAMDFDREYASVFIQPDFRRAES